MKHYEEPDRRCKPKVHIPLVRGNLKYPALGNCGLDFNVPAKPENTNTIEKFTREANGAKRSCCFQVMQQDIDNAAKGVTTNSCPQGIEVIY